MTQSDQLTIAELKWIDDQCVAFESALKSGDTPSIEASLEHMGDPPRSSKAAKRLRSALLKELVTLEIAYRGHAESVSADDYLKRFPQDHELVHAVLQDVPPRHPVSSGASPNTVEMPNENVSGSVSEVKPGDHSATMLPVNTNAGAVEESGLAATDSQGLLSKLNHLGVLSQDEVNALSRMIASGESNSEPRQLATQLVEQGKLTEYQASALLDGQPELLIDKYLILDLLDAGGMGMVFKAIHRPMNRTVAVKMIAQQLLALPEQVKRFQREVRVAATLEHPNVVRAYDADQANGVHFLVMEYVRGENLAKVVHRDGPLSLERAVDTILQAARGLSYAHRQGVIHRDIKPGNLMLTNDGQIKVLDLGLANVDESFRLVQQRSAAGAAHDVNPRHSQIDLTTAGTALGTVAFMAPEQSLDAHHADARSDIYSLGCTFFFLLTGEHPFKGDSVFQIFLQHREGPIPELHECRPDVPKSIEAIFRKMMAKEPGDRLPSMDDLLTEIEACDIALPERNLSQTQEDRPSLGTQPTTSDKETQSRSVTRRRGRRPALLGFVGLACVVALIFAGSRVWRPTANNANDKQVLIAETADEDRGAQSGESSIETSNETSVSAADLLATGEYEWRAEKMPEPINSDAAESGADMTADGLTIVFASLRREGSYGKSDLFAATRKDIDEPWSEAVNLGDTINTEVTELFPALSPDGLSLIYKGADNDILVSNRESASSPWSQPTPYDFQTSYPPDMMESQLAHVATQFHRTENGVRNRDLYIARRSAADAPWPNPTRLPELINTDFEEDAATLSEDGRVLVFTRHDPADPDLIRSLWMTTRQSWDNPWSNPVPITSLNTSGHTQNARFLPDGKSLIYCSHLDVESKADIYLARLVRKDTPRNETQGVRDGPEEQVAKPKTTPPDGFGLKFDGDGDYVQLPFFGYDGKSPLTIEVSYEAQERQVPNTACLSIDGLVWIESNRDSTGWRLTGRSGDKQFDRAEAPLTQLTGSRNHLATVFDGNDIFFFINGRKQNVEYRQLTTGQGYTRIDSVRFSPTHRMTGAGHSLLGGIYMNNAKFSGTIDEVRISTTARYTEDYSLASRLEADEHTLALYHFDEGQGDVLNDSSGNKRHGRIVGPTWVRLDGRPVNSATEDPGEPGSKLPESPAKTTPANED